MCVCFCAYMPVCAYVHILARMHGDEQIVGGFRECFIVMLQSSVRVITMSTAFMCRGCAACELTAMLVFVRVFLSYSASVCTGAQAFQLNAPLVDLPLGLAALAAMLLPLAMTSPSSTSIECAKCLPPRCQCHTPASVQVFGSRLRASSSTPPTTRRCGWEECWLRSVGMGRG